MLIDTSQDYAYRVNGIPLYYTTSTSSSGNIYCKEFYTIPPYSPYATPSPPCDLLMTSKIVPSPRNLTPSPLITLTPPLSPSNSSNASTTGGDQSRRRNSVIMKVENCQITPNDGQQINIDHVCRWENCYR